MAIKAQTPAKTDFSEISYILHPSSFFKEMKEIIKNSWKFILFLTLFIISALAAYTGF